MNIKTLTYPMKNQFLNVMSSEQLLKAVSYEKPLSPNLNGKRI